MKKSKSFQEQLPFWLITATLIVALVLPALIQNGMFMDGVLYASVARNLSLGIGTFWFPQFSLHNIAGLSSFHEHPPLVFGIESLFFRILGSGLYTERFYSFLTLIATGWLINLLWKEIYRDDSALKSLGWMPVLLWITIPLCFWSYSNNMIENTSGFFTLAAVLFSFKGQQSETHKLYFFLLSGIFVFLASFSKGLVGFFPVATPFLFWICTRRINFSKAAWQTSILILPALLIYIVLFSWPPSKESLSIYLFKRALHRINEAPTVSSRFVIIDRLRVELWPQFLLVVILLLKGRVKRKEGWLTTKWKVAVFLIAIGLSASVSLALTMVQKGFYLVPSFPFYAMGCAILISPDVMRLTDRINAKPRVHEIILRAGAFLFIVSIIVSFAQMGKTRRDQETLHDIRMLGPVIHPFQTISIPGEMWGDWTLQCYLIRYYNISVDVSKTNKYYLAEKSKSDAPAEYSYLNMPTLSYDLYVHK